MKTFCTSSGISKVWVVPGCQVFFFFTRWSWAGDGSVPWNLLAPGHQSLQLCPSQRGLSCPAWVPSACYIESEVCSPKGLWPAELIFAAKELFIICYIWSFFFFSSFPSSFCIFPHPLPLTVGRFPSTFSSPLGTYINRQISYRRWERDPVALLASCFL
jgi:hypothetical protein